MQVETWPDLPLNGWKDTYETLHRWTQIVGKIRLRQTAWINHSWHVTLYPTARGLTTSAMRHGARTFQIDFDFIDHQLLIRCSDGGTTSVALRPRSVADFYREVMSKLAALGLPVRIYAKPNELEDATPFEQDEAHAAYDPEYAARWWRIMAQATCVFQEFRARFLGKCSPVHFFWGSFDLAVTRFSGRTAPPHPGGMPHLPDWVAREAYSHEVSSLGFWPGGGPTPFALFYSYAYPEPAGFAAASVAPATARYHDGMGEFVLPYDDVRRARTPDAALLQFAQSTYDAAADLGGWDRLSLERRQDTALA
jgi:Family of unknown function (DUF5996)